MLPLSITLILFAQVHCEWVEISQQHYKKPLRSHTHPLLATVGKVNDVEKTTKVNRVYINHSLPEYNWDTGSVSKRPNINLNGMQLDSSTVNFKPDYNSDQRVTESDEVISHKSKNDVIIIRKPKPEVNRATNRPTNSQTIPPKGSVVRVRPVKAKEPNTRRKPPDEYKGTIEVMNMSDLDYVTEEDPTTAELDEDVVNTEKYNRKQSIGSSTTPAVNKFKTENNVLRENDLRRTTSATHGSQKPKDQVINNLKGSNIRRVEIASTKPTPKENHDNKRNHPNKSSPETELINDDRKTIYKFPNLGHIKRVQIANTTVKTHRPKPDTRKETSTVHNEGNKVENIRKVQNPTRKVDSTGTRVSTTENIYPITVKDNKNKFNRKRPDINVSPEKIMLEEILKEEEVKQDIRVHKVASMGSVKRVSHPKEEDKDYENRRNNYGPNKPLTETPPGDIDEEVFVEDGETINILNRDYSDDYTTSTEKVSVFTSAFKPKKNSATKRPEVSTQIESYERNPYRPVRPSQETIPEFVTKQELFNYESEFEPTERNKVKTSKVTTEASSKKTETQTDGFNDEDGKYSNSPSNKTKKENISQEVPEEPISSDTKAGTMENLIKFLKTVTNIIAKNSRRGVSGKLRYLEDLRDTILANIEERIEAAFPDDDAAPRRRARATAEPRGHVEFPSSESALMTISFLTFAVFLIKLVLQVIQAYKNKTMMVMPTMVAAVGRALNNHRSRN